MKLKLYMLMMAIFAVCAVSCSDDDEPVVKPAEEVAGLYDGYTVASCAYFSNSATANEQLKITAESDATATVTFTSATWGTFTITNATVTKGTSSYTVKGTGVTVMGHAGSEKSYECTVEGTIASGVSTFTFNVVSVMGGLKIVFNEGEIPAELVVAGSYSGYTKATAKYFPDGMYTDNQTITVTANGNGTYSVNYTSETWGEFTIDNAELTVSNDVYTLTGEGETVMGMNGTANEYACTLTATIDIDKENPKFSFSVPSVMGGLTVEFLTGDMPSAE